MQNFSGMQSMQLTNLHRVLQVLTSLLILKVTASVVLMYRDYFPPNFGSDFLHDRQTYFFGAYQWAFYVHILVGPVALILGLLLISERFRIRLPKWHRLLGKAQILLVLLLLVPSGLWMARYAQTGVVASIGFSTLAVLTGLCAVFGWRSAVKRRFADHRCWMFRCFLLLSSAVVVRLVGGLATVLNAGVDWLYPLTAWMSWLVPLAAYELSRAIRRRVQRSSARQATHFPESSVNFSCPAIEIKARS